MIRSFFTITAAVFFSLLLVCSGSALASEEVGVGVKAGTLGGGVELSVSILENTRLRGSLNYLTYSFDSTISDINYDFESKFNSLSLLLDWHPFGGAFYLSGGAYINNNTVDVTGSVDRDIISGGYPGYAFLEDLVSISGEVTFIPVAPYLGIGWRSNVGESGWGIACDLGVMFQGSPDVSSLRVNSFIDVNGREEVQRFLADQEQEIEDELSNFQYYPVASLMLIYNF